MKIVIELDKEHWQESTVLRQLADANRRQETESADHWIELESPFMSYTVTRIVGVLQGPGEYTGQIAVVPLEAEGA